MTKWNVRCDEMNLTHDQMIELNKEGSLNLLIVDSLEKQIDSLAQNESKNISSGYKLTKRKIIALGVLGVSFYFGINESWGWLGIGLIAAVIIVLKKENNNTNIIDLAIKDAEFFERVKEMKGWTFQIEEGKEKEYLVRPAEEDNDDEIKKIVNIDSQNEKLEEWINEILYEFTEFIENHPRPKSIIDSSELPYPKEEILNAFIASVVLTTDEKSIEKLKSNAVSLANFQENVGPDVLGMRGMTESELKNSYSSDLALILKEVESGKNLTSDESKQLNDNQKSNKEALEELTKFLGLRDEEKSSILKKLDMAEKIRTISKKLKLKLLQWLATIPKSMLDGSEKSNKEENLDDVDEVESLIKWANKITGDFRKYIQKSNITPKNIVDTSELPHLKDEIILGLFAQTLLVEDKKLMPLIKTSIINLADHQENVGPKQLNTLGIDYSEFRNTLESLPDTKTVKKKGFSEEDTDQLRKLASKVGNIEEGTKNYEDFKELVDDDMERFSTIIDVGELQSKKPIEEKIAIIVGFALEMESINIEEILEYR